MMQSLPTTIDSAQLDALLSTLESLPSAEVTRREMVATVTARQKSTGQRVTVFSAISEDGETWAAQSVPGLIRVK